MNKEWCGQCPQPGPATAPCNPATLPAHSPAQRKVLRPLIARLWQLGSHAHSPLPHAAAAAATAAAAARTARTHRGPGCSLQAPAVRWWAAAWVQGGAREQEHVDARVCVHVCASVLREEAQTWGGAA